jgi:hypothetical protein
MLAPVLALAAIAMAVLAGDLHGTAETVAQVSSAGCASGGILVALIAQTPRRPGA